MTLEEREYYFSNLYEDYGIPENISSKDFFDIPILIYRSKKRDIKIDEEINPQQTPQEKFDYSIQTLDYIPNETEKRKNIVNNF